LTAISTTEELHVYPDPAWAGQRPTFGHDHSDGSATSQTSIFYGMDEDGRRFMSAGHCLIVGPTESLFSREDEEELPELADIEWPIEVKVTLGNEGVMHARPMQPAFGYGGDPMIEELIANGGPNFGFRKFAGRRHSLAG
jgi:hypothetical protein